MISISAITSSEERSSFVYLERALIIHSKKPPLSKRLISPISSMANTAISIRLWIPSTRIPLTTNSFISTTNSLDRGSSPVTRPRMIPKEPAVIRATIRWTLRYIKTISRAGTSSMISPFGAMSPIKDKSGSPELPIPPKMTNRTMAMAAAVRAYFNLERTTSETSIPWV